MICTNYLTINASNDTSYNFLVHAICTYPGSSIIDSYVTINNVNPKLGMITNQLLCALPFSAQCFTSRLFILHQAYLPGT